MIISSQVGKRGGVRQGLEAGLCLHSPLCEVSPTSFCRSPSVSSSKLVLGSSGLKCLSCCKEGGLLHQVSPLSCLRQGLSFSVLPGDYSLLAVFGVPSFYSFPIVFNSWLPCLPPCSTQTSAFTCSSDALSSSPHVQLLSFLLVCPAACPDTWVWGLSEGEGGPCLP